MIRSMATVLGFGRPIAVGVLAFGLAACDSSGFFVEPAPGPEREATLTLALQPAGASVSQGAAALGAADRLRVQVLQSGTLVMDTVLGFRARDGLMEVTLPMGRNVAPTVTDLVVELRSGRHALLRGDETVQLNRRQVTTAEVTLHPASVRALSPTRQIGAGIFHTCAVKHDLQAFCWGDNLFGQLGDGTTGTRLTPAAVSGELALREVHAGFVSSCALDAGGRAFCWGENDRGVLGTGASASSPTPVPVATQLRFRTLTMGGLHACGLTADDRAFCWGFNEFGQLGDGSSTDRATPVAAAPGLRFRALAAGYLHTCGLTVDQRAFCWGYNEFGQLGDGSTTHRNAPVAVSGAPALQWIAGGGLHSCGATADGRAFCWGYNRFGQVGDGSAEERRPVATAVAGTPRFRAIVAGGAHTCGISGQNGQVFCWGYNRSGALGTGVFTDSREPTAVGDGLLAQSISAGLHHTCAVTPTDEAVCWGFNRFGQLGDRSAVSAAEPGAVHEVESPPLVLVSREPEYPDALRILLERGR